MSRVALFSSFVPVAMMNLISSSALSSRKRLWRAGMPGTLASQGASTPLWTASEIRRPVFAFHGEFPHRRGIGHLRRAAT